jgi:carbamoyl-phosphate synthase small subunit
LKTYVYPRLHCGLGLRARLLLENGIGIEGCGFGYPSVAVGEVVFSTAQTGYTESLTDPSYNGQILVSSHPMVGNYGVPARREISPQIPLDYESDKIQVEGYVVSELPSPSHHASISNLHSWMTSEGKPGIYKVDTRFLIEIIREYGVLMGAIAVYPEDNNPPSWDELMKTLSISPSYNDLPLAYRVSPEKPIVHRPPGIPSGSISVLDCGLKYGILRSLLSLGLEVTRFPCTSKADLLLDGFDGVVISNGPGNPKLLIDAVHAARDIALSGKPVLGICLGMQLIALGLGAESYKMTYGHRAVNKPVVDLRDGKCYITTHNHGYAIDWASVDEAGLKPWFKQPDDGTLEGLRSRDGMILAVQFHPEGGPGPWDTKWIFKEFGKKLWRYRKYE